MTFPPCSYHLVSYSDLEFWLFERRAKRSPRSVARRVLGHDCLWGWRSVSRGAVGSDLSTWVPSTRGCRDNRVG